MCDQHDIGHADSPASLLRRQVLLGGAATATLASWSAPDALAKGEAVIDTPPNAISPDQALKRLLAGNARYVANAPSQKDFSAGRAARTRAQYPFASIVSCADSRVAPELAFDQGPGDLFVVRVAGNFVNDDGLASLEYGAKFLGIPFIMVLGHTNCGAVGAAVKVVKENARLPGHLPELVNAIKPAVRIAQGKKSGNLVADATVENVRLNVHRLMVSRPIIGELVKAGKVGVAGGVYDLATGKIDLV
ncbi:MAG: carbonic anhydrase [Burkholderiales bacterium]|nr:carbonic anhydrase [Burkholderiales bacterium]